MIDVKPLVLSVTQLNKYIKSIIDEDYNLNCIFLSGEISNFTNHIKSGHLYFTLKDEYSAARAVMFRSNASRLKFEPYDGMKVIIRGRVSVFEAAGQYQVYVDDMQPDGIGALAMQFEQLKERLEKEGLFNASHKKKIPEFPNKVGVITSPTGAAVQDILKILKRRYKCADVVFYPAQVQGDGAVNQLIDGLKTMNEQKACDVIIIGRGGGSIEDLWAFNSEALAREVYNSEIPVISAVGHETDFTIIDFVADLRAATPSAAAELAVPDMQEQLVYIDKLRAGLNSCIVSKINFQREMLQSIISKNCFKRPEQMIEYRRLMLDKYTSSLYNSEENLYNSSRMKFSELVSKLNALSPLNTLSRGYSVAYKNGKVLKSIKSIELNDTLEIRLTDGKAVCRVEKVL